MTKVLQWPVNPSAWTKRWRALGGDVALKAHVAEASKRLRKGKKYVCLAALILLDGPTTPIH